MDHRAIAEAADLLWQARLAGQRLDALPQHCRPQILDDGYAIQDSMAVGSGKSVFGWKLAVTSATGQRRLGINEPLAGRLFAEFVIADGGRLNALPMNMRVIEGEFAFRLGRDLPPREDPYRTEEVMAAVSDLHLAIEVPDSRFERFAEMDAPGMLADDGFAGWFVLGPKLAGWRDLDLETQPVRAIRNGSVAAEGRAANTMGDPRKVLVWLAQDRSKRGSGLKAGDVITTGTLFTPIQIAPGDQVSVEFVDLGVVGASFD